MADSGLCAANCGSRCIARAVYADETQPIPAARDPSKLCDCSCGLVPLEPYRPCGCNCRKLPGLTAIIEAAVSHDRAI